MSEAEAVASYLQPMRALARAIADGLEGARALEEPPAG